jgi:hypothetical protein
MKITRPANLNHTSIGTSINAYLYLTNTPEPWHRRGRLERTAKFRLSSLKGKD